LFMRKGDDIVVVKSSDQEVGLGSKDWGYWFTAFNELMEGKSVSVEKGYQDQHFWMGPTSVSAWNHKYYKYAYYYDGTMPFLINPYVLDADTNRLNFETGLSAMISKITSSSDITEISVLNIEPYLKGEDVHISEPEYDTPVLYGKVKYNLPEDAENLKAILERGGKRSIEFVADNRMMNKFYVALPEKRAMMIVADLSSKESLVQELALLLVIAFLAAFLIILAVVRMVAKRRLQPLGEIGSFLQRVSRGDLSGRLEIKSNNELGWLSEQINQMTEQLNSVLTELDKQKEERITRLASYDDLTSLPNRKLYKDRLDQALEGAARSHHMSAVMFLDLDRFKNVNDSLGHAIGDQLLSSVAQRLQSCLEEDHFLARMGGDEFALLVPTVLHVEDVVTVARNILNVFESPIEYKGQAFHLTTSIGISIYAQDGSDAETLLKNADAAMYSAKQQGGNNFQFYTPSMNAMILERINMESRLRDAMANHELLVYYQPLLDIETGQIVGMEALTRWDSPEYGMVSPATFIPIAENSGLIVPIGEWILRTACRQNQVWQEAGYPPMRVSVNLSTRQFELPDLVETVAAILEETGLSPEYLKLEITESLAMQNPDSAIQQLHALKQLGIEIAIDDFGTGYSSLNYLKKFPIDTLKIDRSFVGDIPGDSDDAAIVTAIIAMAHNLKINVIAEGVETEEQLVFLREQRCDEMQGYLFSRPVPAEEFEALLIEGRDLYKDIKRGFVNEYII
ncbi:MAG: EAL domain-containing protein, partial [Tumebacillaceae bacterium]